VDVLTSRPLTILRDTLLRPKSESHIPEATVAALLKYHLAKLQQPASPFTRKDSAARTALQGSTISIPGTVPPAPKLEVDKASRSIALRLADAAGLNELTAFLLWKSYASHSIEDTAPAAGQTQEDAILERLMLWYEQELLAAPQIVMALYVPASQATGWEDLAAALRDEILGDQASYIEGLFRAFSLLAQKSVGGESDSLSRGLYW
jgi:nuclear pore complex protein Nup188